MCFAGDAEATAPQQYQSFSVRLALSLVSLRPWGVCDCQAGDDYSLAPRWVSGVLALALPAAPVPAAGHDILRVRMLRLRQLRHGLPNTEAFREFPQEAEGVFGLSALNVPPKHLTGLIPAIRDHFPPQESENLGVKSWDESSDTPANMRGEPRKNFVSSFPPA